MALAKRSGEQQTACLGLFARPRVGPASFLGGARPGFIPFAFPHLTASNCRDWSSRQMKIRSTGLLVSEVHLF